MSIKTRLLALEAAQAQRRTYPVAWPSLEAARAAGVPAGAGIAIVGEVLPLAEWLALAAPCMAALTRGHHEAQS